MLDSAMLKKNSQIYFVVILAVIIAFPFVFRVLMNYLFQIESNLKFNDAIFIIEYFKLFGSLLLLLVGAMFAEYLINLRFMNELRKDANFFISNCKIAKEKVIIAIELNKNIDTHDVKNKKELEETFEFIDYLLKTKSNIASSLDPKQLKSALSLKRSSEDITSSGPLNQFDEEKLRDIIVKLEDIIKES